MAQGVKSMPITIDVKPDLSRFVQATWEDLVAHGCTHELANELLEHFVMLPR
jgi:hypothetical protein